MKNLKIKLKLIVSFGIMLAITAAVGAVGIAGMLSLSRADTQMYTNNVLSINTLGLIRENFAQQRLYDRNLALYEAGSDNYNDSVRKLTELENAMDNYLADYTRTASGEDAEAMAAFVADYRGGFTTTKNELIELAKSNATDTIVRLLNSANEDLTKGMVENLNRCYEYNLARAEEAVLGNERLTRVFMLMLFAAIGVSVVLAVYLAFHLSNLIGRPLRIMTKYFKKVADSGDMELSPEDHALIAQCAKAQDETGICISTTASFVNRMLEIGNIMGAVAGGDLTVQLALLSEKDSMGLSLKKMTESLSGMFGDISNSTIQVSTGSRQIADGSQMLAQGATQQAAAVEQLTDSISGVSVKIRENADMAANASRLAASIKHDAEKGSGQMKNMLAAVKDIEEASASISRVIKVIDDIAFQTNILALNAAVEAARAGQHGKGFAVVAEEVRNLAAKSAEAAKNTGGLIANSMGKSELGAQIAAETAESLVEIVSGINESGRIVEEIAKSSEEQAVAMSLINKGVAQVGQVIQQNSATAQEAAAASEEMSEQAALLERLASRFKVNEENLRRVPMPERTPEEKRPAAAPESTSGKY